MEKDRVKDHFKEDGHQKFSELDVKMKFNLSIILYHIQSMQFVLKLSVYVPQEITKKYNDMLEKRIKYLRVSDITSQGH